MNQSALEEYQNFVKEKLEKLTSIFAKASVGDFSQDVEIPEKEDEFTELYVGVQVMQEVIREKIADLTALNQKLQERSEELQAILASIGDGLVVTDSGGKILSMNRVAEEMLGVKKPAGVVGKNWLIDLLMEDEGRNLVPIEQRPLKKVLAFGKPISTTSASPYYYRLAGKIRSPVSFTIAPIFLEGKVIGAVEVFRDVTRELELDRAKTEFVSLAAHQLRTPLSTVKWYVESLLFKKQRRPRLDLEKYLRGIDEANQRMIALVDALLEVARIELGTFEINPKMIDLEKIAREAVRLQAPKLKEKEIKFKATYSKRLAEAFLDPELTRTVLDNLLSNAIRYAPAKGRVDLSVSHKGIAILIKISDTGIGIPEKDKPKIFTKLFRADNAKKAEPVGTGLGLYLVKEIVERQSGKIWFESKGGKGTTFYVNLPIKGSSSDAERNVGENKNLNRGR